MQLGLAPHEYWSPFPSAPPCAKWALGREGCSFANCNYPHKFPQGTTSTTLVNAPGLVDLPANEPAPTFTIAAADF